MNLNNDMRQNIQGNLDFPSLQRVNPRRREGKGPNR